MGGVAVVAAGAGVARGNEHERAGQRERVLGTADGDPAILERLAQHLECFFPEFSKFVGKEYAVVSQRNLARLGIGAATYERHLRDGVVRSAEGSLRDERGIAPKLAGDGVYLCGLQAFCQRQWRQNAGQTLSHHRLATAGTAHHNKK